MPDLSAFYRLSKDNPDLNCTGLLPTVVPSPAVMAEAEALRMAWHYKHVMARLYGTYSESAQRAAKVFDALFAARRFANA